MAPLAASISAKAFVVSEDARSCPLWNRSPQLGGARLRVFTSTTPNHTAAVKELVYGLAHRAPVSAAERLAELWVTEVR